MHVLPAGFHSRRRNQPPRQRSRQARTRGSIIQDGESGDRAAQQRRTPGAAGRPAGRAENLALIWRYGDGEWDQVEPANLSALGALPRHFAAHIRGQVLRQIKSSFTDFL